MSDDSLMNPDYLKNEINDIENKLIPEIEKRSNELEERYDRIIGYVSDTHNRGESTTLTHEQVSDLICTLSEFNQNRWRYTNSYEFSLRVYKRLLKDRRWNIASKLKFLK